MKKWTPLQPVAANYAATRAFIEYLSGLERAIGSFGGGSTAWVDITGKPSTFPPTLPIAQSDVTGLVAALANVPAPATVEVDFTVPARSGFFDKTVSGATVGQKVLASVSIDMPSGVSEDELEMDPVTVSGRVSATNTVRLLVSASQPIFGKRNINLTLG